MSRVIAHRICTMMLGMLSGASVQAQSVAARPALPPGQALPTSQTLPPGQALPTGGTVVSGQVTVNKTSNTLTIDQSSQNAIVDWQSFSIGSGNAVKVVQPNSSSALLDRVTGNTPSVIAGQLDANGEVFLINPNGIAITNAGVIDVGGGFVASTLGLSDQDFKDGKFNLSGNGASAGVNNAGTITVGRGGYAALLGGTVKNPVLIAVPVGKVGLGSGEAATLDVSGDGFLQVAVPTRSSGQTALIQSSGSINAQGGTVIMSAATARSAARNAINLSGLVQANSISGHEGAITLSGGAGGEVAVSGTLDVSAAPGAAPSAGPRVFTVVPNGPEPVLEFACALVEELARSGRAELVWDVRASAHTAEWFNRLEEANDYVVYLAEADATGWTRQCCRQADLVLLAADAHGDPRPWPDGVLEAAQRAGIPIELALLHRGSVTPGAAARWLAGSRAVSHHHIVDGADIGRLARLVTRRGVGLVLSGGGARGFAHLGVIRALREARIPIDFVGGASIGSIIAAGVANGWSDEEMRCRYRRSFVETNPVSDYTFPFVALTRGRKVTGLLRREFTEVRIEDLRVPFFCISASLSTGRAFEHREGPLWLALRASVAIPGVLPPVFLGDEVLVDGAAINNLPVDAMQRHAPGLVIGCDVGAERNLHCDFDPADQPPLWRFFSRSSRGRRRINIFQVLMRAGVINGASTAAAQRELADVLLKPPLDDVDLLNWRAFDRAIAAGYDYARVALDGESRLPRLSPAAAPLARPVSLAAEISRRLQAAALTVRGAPRPPAC